MGIFVVVVSNLDMFRNNEMFSSSMGDKHQCQMIKLFEMKRDHIS